MLVLGLGWRRYVMMDGGYLGFYPWFFIGFLSISLFLFLLLFLFVLKLNNLLLRFHLINQLNPHSLLPRWWWIKSIPQKNVYFLSLAFYVLLFKFQIIDVKLLWLLLNHILLLPTFILALEMKSTGYYTIKIIYFRSQFNPTFLLTLSTLIANIKIIFLLGNPPAISMPNLPQIYINHIHSITIIFSIQSHILFVLLILNWILKMNVL